MARCTAKPKKDVSEAGQAQARRYPKGIRKCTRCNKLEHCNRAQSNCYRCNMYTSMCSNAKSRVDVDPTVMPRDVWEKLLADATHCAATGFKFRQPEPNALLRPSPDKIDNTKGYTPDNVKIVTWWYNRAKGIHDDDEAAEAFALIRGDQPVASKKSQTTGQPRPLETKTQETITRYFTTNAPQVEPVAPPPPLQFPQAPPPPPVQLPPVQPPPPQYQPPSHFVPLFNQGCPFCYPGDPNPPPCALQPWARYGQFILPRPS